ncbi:hypothetical protein GGI20_004897 [Coemansia sp. BCRC 34301]|nr:hypothetical protein GGI20_004897 [Coemansia sp. BCRC 34301]
MRFSLLALTALLALASAANPPAEDYVRLKHPEFKAKYKKEYAEYKKTPANKCVNVKKIFDSDETQIHTQGRIVRLYTDPNCKNMFAKSYTKDGASDYIMHPILSFKVEKK